MTVILRNIIDDFRQRIGQDRSVNLYRTNSPYIPSGDDDDDGDDQNGYDLLAWPDGSDGEGTGVLYEVRITDIGESDVARVNEFLATTGLSGSGVSMFTVDAGSFAVTNVHFQVKEWLMQFKVQSYDEEKANPYMGFQLGQSTFINDPQYLQEIIDLSASQQCQLTNTLQGNDSEIFGEELSQLNSYEDFIRFNAFWRDGSNPNDPPEDPFVKCEDANVDFTLLVRFVGRHSEQIVINEEAFINPAIVTLLEDYLAAPLSFSATVDDRDVQFSWQTVEFAEGYNLFVNGKKVNEELIPSVDHWSQGYELQNLELGTINNAYVVAVKGDVKSAGSNTQEFSISTPPPEDVGAGIDDSSLTLQWNAVQDAEGYNVYLNGQKVNAELITATEYTIEQIESGSYDVQITSVVGEVESKLGEVHQITVSGGVDSPQNFSVELLDQLTNPPENFSVELIAPLNPPENFDVELVDEVSKPPENFNVELVYEVAKEPENFNVQLIDNASLIPENFDAGQINMASLVPQNFDVDQTDMEALIPKNFSAAAIEKSELSPGNFEAAQYDGDQLIPENFHVEQE